MRLGFQALCLVVIPETLAAPMVVALCAQWLVVEWGNGEFESGGLVFDKKIGKKSPIFQLVIPIFSNINF